MASNGAEDILIPELSQWNDGAGISLKSWLDFIGRYDHAVAYSTLFWPTFSLFDDCVFLSRPERENYEEWLHILKGDKSKVEFTLNHQHIGELFPHSDYKPTVAVIRYLGDLLLRIWTCKLRQDFPGRKFEVRLFHENDEANLQLSFSQLRA